MDPTSWIGRSETATETISPEPLRRWAATLGFGPETVADGTALPPVAHWGYFRPAIPADGLMADGHSEINGLLPSDLEHPRRMWAGGTLTFHEPLRVGDAARRISVVEDVVHKTGRSGSLLFITVHHRIERDDGTLLIDERQDMVRRAPPRPDEVKPDPTQSPTDPTWSKPYSADALKLFRYSAVTFNGHRIHYDRDYSRDVEHYPSLVVHGPMLATLLMALAEEKSGEALATFAYRALSPTFEDEVFTLNGSPTTNGAGHGAEMFVAGSDGRLAMRGEATFSPA